MFSSYRETVFLYSICFLRGCVSLLLELAARVQYISNLSSSSDSIITKTELLTPEGDVAEEEEDNLLNPGNRDNGTSDITTTTSRQRTTSSPANTSTGRIQAPQKWLNCRGNKSLNVQLAGRPCCTIRDQVLADLQLSPADKRLLLVY